MQMWHAIAEKLKQSDLEAKYVNAHCNEHYFLIYLILIFSFFLANWKKWATGVCHFVHT